MRTAIFPISWTEEAQGFVIGVAVSIAFILLTFTAVFYVYERRCYERWADYNPTWGFYQKCMVEVNGQRVPSEVARYYIFPSATNTDGEREWVK